MANDLAALTIFTGNLFRHAYFILPWLCKHAHKCRCRDETHDIMVGVLDCLKRHRPMFFGPNEHLDGANSMLAEFYDCMATPDTKADETQALRHYDRAWHNAWLNRSHLQLRGHEVRLMRLFHEITCKGDMSHLPELIAMARCVDRNVVSLARSIDLPQSLNTETALQTARAELAQRSTAAFGCEHPDPDTFAGAKKKNPAAFEAYQSALREFKRLAHLRIIELFDERDWHPTIDSATLHILLKNEGLDEYLPYTFRGRIGVQPTGYPLTFYTYDGLELEKPPLHDVKMNINYETCDQDKDHGIHPAGDSTFYCTSRPQVGDSELKYYTLEYKRRARRIKYETVAKLATSITKVRRRLMKHIESADRDTWVRALMCLIIDRRCARIGNTESARAEKKTYGITTLMTKKHVRVAEGRITLRYAGKHERPQQHTFQICSDPAERARNRVDSIIADRLIQLIQENNVHLFTRANGKPFTPQSVNEYFTADRPDPDKGLPEGGACAPCTVHNLRNYHATSVFKAFAAAFARENIEPSYQDVLTAYQGRTGTAKRPAVKGVLDIIAEKLGNTPAICRKAYIDPRDQLMFFKRWGYRPPDGLIRDLFVHEPTDTYGVEPIPHEEPLTACNRKVCRFQPADAWHIFQRRKSIAATRRKKSLRCGHAPESTT